MRAAARDGRLPGMDIDLSDVRPGLLLGGRYRLVEQIGVGGMAVVWRARDDVLARAVAVKLLAPHARDAESLGLIRREARAAAALSHPNVAQVYDYGEAVAQGEPAPYVVFELVRGGTLLERLRSAEVPARYALRICAEVGAALAAAHAEGLVHRDIKPANIMLSPTGVKVVDFGIAAAVATCEDSADDILLGTPTYVAPERLTGSAVEPASDVYALGVLLYQLLSGATPWPAESPTRLLANHLWAEPPPLVPRTPVPGHVLDLCARCLRKDPAARPTAREATRLLAHAAGLEVVEDVPAPAAGAPVPAEPSMIIRRPRARRARWLAVGGGLVAAAGVIGLVVWRGVPAPSDHTAEPAITRSATAEPIIGRTPEPGRTHGTVLPIRPSEAVSTTTGPSVRPSVVPATPPPATPPPATPPPATPPSAPATPRERVFTSKGGTLTATCPSASTARILSWTATSPYRAGQVDTAPGPAPSGTFRHGKSQITMTVTCDAGVPAVEVDQTA